MKKNILIFGSKSFVANGLQSTLDKKGYHVEAFSRGCESKINNVIYGKIMELCTNVHFNKTYDTVINFIVLKDETTVSNIEYIKQLIDFCKKHQVKKLIHFSTIMNYNYNLAYINEQTKIETLETTTKKGYAEFKIAVDNYLLSIKDTLPFEVIFVRPGYVLADNKPCPFLKKIPFGITLIKGNYRSKQPIVQREDIHHAILRIIEIEKNNPVYHFFPNNDMTKYKYAKQTTGGFIIPLPKLIFKEIPRLLCFCGVVSKSLYSRFEGMYIESKFDSTTTEQFLNIKFQ